MELTKIIQEDINLILSRLPQKEIFRNKTVLISGAAGFLPAYLVEVFMHMSALYNIKVIALIRNITKAQNRFAHWINDPRLMLVQQDVSIPFSLKEKINFIIHAASQASPKYYGIDPVGTLNANVLGTINLINLAKEHKVESFLFFSSGEVYGEVKEEDIPIKEDTYGYLNPATVRACYGESKRMGENICVSYHSQYGVNAKIVRPFHTYGPGMALDDGRVFADFVANAVNKQDIIVKSDGGAIRAFCYLTDATLGFLKVLIDGENGQAYNIGNPNQEYSIFELANIIIGIYPEFKIRLVKQVSTDSRNAYLKSPIKRNSPNIEKAIKLGWKPEVSVQDGFKRTIDSFLAQQTEII
jgi:nucleoside-diphosphate-sugar epimerase